MSKILQLVFAYHASPWHSQLETIPRYDYRPSTYDCFHVLYSYVAGVIDS
jgi:hypothetical protein